MPDPDATFYAYFTDSSGEVDTAIRHLWCAHGPDAHMTYVHDASGGTLEVWITSRRGANPNDLS